MVTHSRSFRSFVFKNTKHLNERLKYWQEVLKLSDWDIKVRVCRGNGLDLPADTAGNCFPTPSIKMASIKIIDASDWPPDSMIPLDQEQILVHELLHLHFAPFMKEPGHIEWMSQEQAVNCIADGLIAANDNK